MTVPAATDACGADAVLCTDDDKALSNTASIGIRGPAAISVADASAHENNDDALVFNVTLDRPALQPITVDYATQDGTATAGADYTATSGTLTFAVEQRTKTVRVPILDDSHDDTNETVTLGLSNASGARIEDGEATGTIENADPLPRALLARFGRTAAVHVVEHVEARLQAPRAPAFEGRFAGRKLRRGMERDIALNILSRLGASAGQSGSSGLHDPLSGTPAAGAGTLATPGLGGGTFMGTAGPRGAGADGLTGQGRLPMGLGSGDLLTGSDVALTRETRGGLLSF